jgi:hypothetical protein
MVSYADDFVPITGLVHLPTSLRVFLDVEERRIFFGIPILRLRVPVLSPVRPLRSMCVVASRKRRDSPRVDRECEDQHGYGERPTVTRQGTFAVCDRRFSGRSRR